MALADVAGRFIRGLGRGIDILGRTTKQITPELKISERLASFGKAKAAEPPPPPPPLPPLQPQKGEAFFHILI